MLLKRFRALWYETQALKLEVQGLRSEVEWLRRRVAPERAYGAGAAADAKRARLDELSVPSQSLGWPDEPVGLDRGSDDVVE